MIGEILGNRYEILEQIGEGGMAIVYKAMDSKLSRNVAVKVLKKELSDNEDIVNKFKREATAVATLTHTNLVNVLDVGTQDEINYIVMEYVKGKTLKEMIVESGKLNYETTIRIGKQIAQALDCAHKNKIIHRDVKPQNVLVSEDGLIKVTDFGIAKSADSATLTNTTTIMGSAQYLSPEQARGSVVDTRTDIYSLGIVIYEMATGKLPFEADSPVTIALKHIQEEAIPPKQLNSAILDSLNRLILKAMEKDPNKRYQTAKEIISDLDKIKEDPNVVIDKSQNDDDGKTVVMQSKVGQTVVMQATNPNLGNPNKDQDSYEYEEFEDEDYYDDNFQQEKEIKKETIKESSKENKKENKNEVVKKENNKLTPKNNKKIITGIIAVLAILLVFGVAATFLSRGNKTGDIKVPDIKGMTLDQAKDTLTKAGLTLEEGGTVKSSEKANTVVEVTPDIGSIAKKGDSIRVMLSAGETKIKIPDIEEQSIEKAKQILEKYKLTNYIIKKQNSDSISSGDVISTNPAVETEVTPDTKITIYVSSGSGTGNGSVGKKVTIPDLKDKSLQDAAQALDSLGLSNNTVPQNTDDEGMDNKVISTSPSSGETVKSGTQVTINYYKYKLGDNKKVDPSSILKVGMTQSEARAVLDSSSLSYKLDGPNDGTLVKWEDGFAEGKNRIILTFSNDKKNSSDQTEDEK